MLTAVFLSEKSFEAAATEAEGSAGEGAATWEGAWEREAAYCQTCEKNVGSPSMSVCYINGPCRCFSLFITYQLFVKITADHFPKCKYFRFFLIKIISWPFLGLYYLFIFKYRRESKWGQRKERWDTAKISNQIQAAIHFGIVLQST